MIISIQKKIYSNSKQATFTRKGVQAFSVSMLALKAMNTLTASPGNHTSYVKKNGDLWTTGKNDEGQLGIGTNIDVDTPTIVSLGGFGVVSLGAGISVSLGNTWAGVSLGGVGSVSLGNGVFGVSLGGGVLSLNPGHNDIGGNGWGVSLGESGFWISKVAIGGGHTIFVHRESFSKNAYLSGRNSSGQLGNGSQTPRNGYAYGLSGVRDAAAGESFSLFLKEDGSLWGTGGNEYGQLGLGHENNQSVPQMIVSSGVQRVSAGFDHAFYIKSDGSLWGMGRNDHGQLGTGDQIDRNQSVLILSSGISQVSAGKDHTLIVKTDGSLWAMGKNDLGQLGTGDTNIRLIPTRIEPDGVKQASAGLDHSLFVKWNGSLRGMGYDDYGELGRSSPASLLSPTELVASDVEQVSAGRHHTHYLKRDGTLWGMGSNTAGSLGTGDKINQTTAVQIDSDVARLADFPFPHPYWRKLVAPDRAAGDKFGNSVSLSGNVLAVGANFADPGGISDAGAVYLYRIDDNGTISRLHKVRANNGAADDQFGNSVSLSGNLLAVGERLSDKDGVFNAGEAYLYRLENNGSVTLTTKVSAPVKAVNDYFGNSVSLSGNILAVGAHEANPNGVASAGVAYLYRVETNGSASYLTQVSALDKEAGDVFGWSISLSGDLLAVAAPQSDPNGLADAGATYLYRLETNGSATHLTKVTAPDKAANNRFGYSVSLSGNILAVGADDANGSSNGNAGAVYLYNIENNGSASLLQKVTANDGMTNDKFGASVSVSGNVLAVGAIQADPGGVMDAGASYIYRIENNGSVSFVQKLTANDGAPSDAFGSSVSASGGFLAIGAPMADPGWINDSGAAYLYEIGPSNDPPADLNATGVLTMAENQPIGTVVGAFDATDPDGVIKSFTTDISDRITGSLPIFFEFDANADLSVMEIGFACGGMDDQVWVFKGQVPRTLTLASELDALFNSQGIFTSGPWQTFGASQSIPIRYDKFKIEMNATDVQLSFTPHPDNYAAGYGQSLYDSNIANGLLKTNFPNFDSDKITVVTMPFANTATSEGYFSFQPPMSFPNYRLISGVGDVHNGLFTLDQNGTLKTAATFDFESNTSSYSIRVQAKDELNATVEGSFTVSLTDVDDPPVVANPIGTVSATQNDANTTIDLTNVFNDQDNINSSITKSAVSSNPSLVTAGVSGNVLTLDYQTDKNGTATITVTGNSNSQDVNATFLVTVANVPLSVSSNSPTGQTAGLDPTLTIVFSESIQAGTGNVQLFSTSPENLEESFDVASSPNLTFSGNTLTIDPSITLTSGKTYNVRFDSGAVVEAGNGDGWGGLATPSTWSFIANATPVITSSASANSAENQLSAYMITASDAESNAITYGIAGGADQAKFLINSSTGALTWQSAPDFEVPTDVGGTNTYEVTVSATDGFSTATLAVTVSVTDDGSEDTDNDKFLDGEETAVGSSSTDPNVTPLDIGMEAFYPFTGNANDTSGNARHGTAHGPALVADRHGSASSSYDFNGSGDYVSVPVGSGIDTNATDFSISLWVYPRSTTGAFVEQGSGGSPNGRTVLSNASGNLATSISSDGNGLTGSALTLNQWNHVVLTYDLNGSSAQVSLYHNGAYDASRTIPGPESSNQNYIFGKEDSNTGYLDGQMDDVRIYNRALTSKAIALLFLREKINDLPTGLALSTSTVPENASAVTTLGTFSTTDPDDVNATDTYLYTLVGGTGSTDNGAFTLDVNGTLKTSQTFDYEVENADANATRSIRVQTQDPRGGVLQKIFLISVTDVNEAPVINEGASVSTVMDEDGSPTTWLTPALSATDPEGAVLTWSALTPPANGTVTVSGTGANPNCLYVPNRDFNGSDSFVLQVSDGTLTDSVTVNVTVTPRPDNDLIPIRDLVTYDLNEDGSNNYLISVQGKPETERSDPPLVLLEGVTYVFENRTSGHPFFIGTAAGWGNPYGGTEVTGNGVYGPIGAVTFSPDANTPRNLTYYCGAHSAMQGTILISKVRESKFIAPDLGANSGFSVVSAYGNEVLTAAPNADVNGSTDVGRAYIFGKDINGTWTAGQVLAPADPLASSKFGDSLSLTSGRALIGRPGRWPELDQTGSAYLFDKDLNGTWIQAAKLVPSDSSLGDLFGSSVSLGQDLAVVGAHYADDSARAANASFTINDNTTLSDHNFTLTPAGGAPENFQEGVDWNASVTADGSATTLAAIIDASANFSASANGAGITITASTVGANANNSAIVTSHPGSTVGSFAGGMDAATNSGAAYVFAPDGNGTWGEVARLTSADRNASDRFGASVSLDGNLLLVGAPHVEVNGSSSAGAAYLFEKDANGTWSQTAKLNASDGVAGDVFGNRVALDGDFAAVGAYRCENGPATDAGAVYLFKRDANGTWAELAKLTSSDGQTEDYFGRFLDLRGNRLVVGAPGNDQDSNRVTPGGVYLFEPDANGTWQQADKYVPLDAEAQDRFGHSVSIGASIFAGSHGNDDRGASSGSIYAFENPSWSDSPPVLDREGEISVIMDEDGSPVGWIPPVVSASDPDGDVVSWRAYYDDPAEANGTLIVSGTGTSPPVFEYFPARNFYGTDVFVLEASDGVSTDTVTVRVTVNPQFDEGEILVKTMPSFSQDVTYGNAIINQAVKVWGAADGGTAPYTYELDFGDGQSQTGAVTNPDFIGADHIYTSSGLRTVKLKVTDANGEWTSRTSSIRVFMDSDVTLEVRENVAIEKALLYLYQNSTPDGATKGLKWLHEVSSNNNSYRIVGTTAFATLAFMDTGHLPGNNPQEDVYAEVVQKGLNYLLANPHAGFMNIPAHSDGIAVRDSDTAGGRAPGQGIYLHKNGSHDTYANGLALLAVVTAYPDEATAKAATVSVGPFSGWSYYEVIVEAIDLIKWYQGDGDRRGSWAYGITQTATRYDGSTQQWPTMVLKAAEDRWGIISPQWVKDNALYAMESRLSSPAGGIGYSNGSSSVDVGKTGGGLVTYLLAGKTSQDPVMANALTYVGQNWLSATPRNQGGPGWVSNLYGAFAIKKGLDSTDLDEVVTPLGNRDWQKDMSSWMLGLSDNLPASFGSGKRNLANSFGQNADGTWEDTWVFKNNGGKNIRAAVGVGILARGLTDFPPKPIIDSPSAVPANASFPVDGSRSYHADVSKGLVEWKWVWNAPADLSQIDWNASDASGPRPLHPGYANTGSYTVALRVKDDGTPARYETKTAVITVSSGDHAPIAEPISAALRPAYAAKIGEAITLDGSESYDLDPGGQIVEYEWDLAGSGSFTSASATPTIGPFSYPFQGQVGLRVRDANGTWSSPRYVDVYVSANDLVLEDLGFLPFNMYDTNFTVRATIRNDAASTDLLRSVEGRFYDGDPLTGGNPLSPVYRFDLLPNQTAQADVVLQTASYPPFVHFFVDPAQRVFEWNESNNLGSVEIIPNYPPTDITLLPWTVPENLPAYSAVGSLLTTDLDDLNGTGTYLYEMIDENATTDNGLFYIDANATLRTSLVFDYESSLANTNRARATHAQIAASLTAAGYPADLHLFPGTSYPLYNIRVRTTDEYNASFTKTISVAILDRNDEIPALPAPSDVALDGGFLKENQPAGTWAGYFRAPHAVAPEPSKVYSHTLVDGNGSADNASFSLDLNGTLSSSAVFDFETKNAYQIRVRSTDPFGGFREQAFVINVVDCFIPVVETLSPINLIATSAQLHGRLVDDGALTVLERGFVLGSQPDPSLGQADVLSIPGISSIIPGGFQSESGVLSSRLKYYYRAYVINSEGIGYGLEESFLTQGDVKKPSWIESTPGAAKDWWSSAWFGNFFQSSNGWVMHETLGWIYPVKSKSAGMWFWMTGEGWLWTDAGLYPRVYADNYSSWVYFYGALQGKKLFYVYREERWITATSAEN